MNLSVDEDGIARRDHPILRELAQGASNAQIAERTGFTESTVSQKITKMNNVLGTTTRELVVYALHRFPVPRQVPLRPHPYSEPASLTARPAAVTIGSFTFEFD